MRGRARLQTRHRHPRGENSHSTQKNTAKNTSKITFRSHPNAQRPAGWSGRETHLSDCALTHCSSNPAPQKVGGRGEHLSDCPCDLNLNGFDTPQGEREGRASLSCHCNFNLNRFDTSPKWTGGNKVFVVRRRMCQSGPRVTMTTAHTHALAQRDNTVTSQQDERK